MKEKILKALRRGEGLKTHTLGSNIIYYEKINSTQRVAGELAAAGADEGTIVIAETQAAGRGRIGRSWASPPGGVYLSVILRPDLKPTEAVKFTLVAGISAVRAIAKLTDLEPKLKWPNDIIVAGKKVGGILTEMNAEMDRINYIIIGIGINVNTRRAHFPEEIAGIATSLRAECGKEVSRVKLAQEILVQLESLYEDFGLSGFEPIRERWKAFSNTIGARVSISSGGKEVKGEAIDIDGDGALILRKANGALERVIAGDVSEGCLSEINPERG
ncbi:MAG: Bifunctional ligase/repressor BirA [candidate division WS2 bacterium]|nr:Bifunctional ligase/repressor BirA [Candidatus Psychracetigena formicireducens]